MIFKHFREDIDVVLSRDPAARSRLEVILCYPGLHALLFHRLAHRAWQSGWRVLGRFLSHLGRLLTGIEIHPGADDRPPGVHRPRHGRRHRRNVRGRQTT